MIFCFALVLFSSLMRTMPLIFFFNILFWSLSNIKKYITTLCYIPGVFLLILYVARPKDVVCQVLLQAQYLWPCAKHNNISVKALCQYYVCISLYGCFTWPTVTSAVKLLIFFTLVWLYFEEKIEKPSPLTTRLLSCLSSYPIQDLIAGRSEPSYPLSLSLSPHCPSLLISWSFSFPPNLLQPLFLVFFWEGNALPNVLQLSF